MKNIILIRHAKSDWDFLVDDKYRTINNRGILDSNLIAKNSSSFLQDDYTVWCSTATRAMQTAKFFTDIYKFPYENIIFIEALYTFEINQLEKQIKNCSDDVKNLIIFGHNSAITDFVNKFGDIFIDNVPTSGFVSLDLESNNWATISKGKTLKTLFPKELK